MKKIKLSRESVAMGDAPHLMEFEIHPDWKIKEILKNIIKSGYLPKIYGRKSTWSVAINEPIAVITQENPKSLMLICLSDFPYKGTKSFVDIEHIHFSYHQQKKPDEVFEVLSRFRIKP
ncbi:hypothetical protein [Lutibacter sp. B1]|uniref:hypothetical protein n=1 Tax=Lutibacter sp. B1 TaxID=2725996 RepID=UPI0014576FB9|nr:hypothetical protein [Lutibacter sp. B1]NLP59501.1 hypothetical protein [Lutibacter sp. B1]